MSARPAQPVAAGSGSPGGAGRRAGAAHRDHDVGGRFRHTRVHLAERLGGRRIESEVEIATGRRHDIPSVDDCRACHDSARTEILGFSALQLSTDRDPIAPHAEPLAPDMVTLRTLVEERLLAPPRPELVTSPPRIDAPDARTRAVLGYLSSNCGSCHNETSTLAPLRLLLKPRLAGAHGQPDALVRGLRQPTAKWQIPQAPEGASAFVTPGAPDLSALLVRMRSRRPSSQMPRSAPCCTTATPSTW
jgi:hypothetical protein